MTRSFRNVKHIFFDFDGVLCDSLNMFIKAYPLVQKKLNLPPMDLEGLKTRPLSELCKEHKIYWWKQLRLVLEMRREAKFALGELHGFPGMKEVILELKHKKIHLNILTSNDQNNVEKFLKKFGMHHFDSIYSSWSIFGKHTKMKKILRKKKLKASEVIYVGDEVRDIVAMKKINVPIIAVSWGWNSEELLSRHHPTVLVRSPSELASLF